MPDTETLDRVLDIITRVPHLHDQSTIVGWVADPAAARQELAAAPDVRQLVAPKVKPEDWPTHSCGSAYCVGGWVLIVKGYTERNWDFFAPEADLDRCHPVADPLDEAALVLGIDPYALNADRDHYLPTLFSADATLPQIRAWVAFYKGDIDKDTLITLLELHMEEDR